MDLNPGDVWWAHPDPGVGREQSGRRPVVILSSPLHLRLVDTLVMVVPISSRDRGWPNHVDIDPSTAGVAGFAMSEQLRTISRDRLIERTGAVDAVCCREIRSWIDDFLIGSRED